LLLRPSFKDVRDIPCGYVEPSEIPAASCQRELLGEAALDGHGRLLVVA
jgi:hypothetical protein